MLNSFLLKKSKVLTINNQKYVIDEQIGEGAFGYVYKVHDINNSKLFYAIKKIICQSSEQLEEAQHEINLLTTIQHGNVLSLHMSCVQSNKSSSTSSSENMEVYLLLPLYQESLQNIIDTSSGYPECGLDRRDVQKIIFGCVNGIHAIHLAGYRHGDIKPANVLLDADRNPVITDFGSAEPLSTEITNRQQALSVQDRAATKTTASFRAPELFDTPSHCIIDGKSDVWALGCTYYAMLFSRTPFEAPVEGLSVLAVMSGNFSFPSSSTWPPEYHTMISACLRVDLEQRLSIEDLKILAGILPDPVDYLTLSSPSPSTAPSPSHKEVKHDGFGHSLMKKLTNKEPVHISSDEISFEPNFSSFADFENFQKHATPSVRNKLDPAPQSLHKAAAASSSNHEEISSKVTEVVLQQEEDNEDEEWNFQSCEATLLVSDVPIESSAIQQGEEVIQNNEIPIPQLGHQESDDFDEEFGDFQAAEKRHNSIEVQNFSDKKESHTEPTNVEVRRDNSVESINSKFASLEMSGPIYMMRTRRSLLLKQKVKKKLWLHLHGNQITIQKTSDDDSKIHFIGILSRKTTSIRPIISPDLGRDTLLLEGVQISNKRRLENEDEDDIVHDQLKDADGSVTKTITMEIGFETSEEIEKWLQVTQDIIN